MMKWIGFALCVVLLSGPSAVHSEVVRFLVVGDSWAEEQWLDGSHQRVFASRGLETVRVSGELTTTSGSTAADWVMPVNLERIRSALDSYPHIDTVQLTVGGNDFLDTWNTGFSEAAFAELIGWIQSDLEVISNFILNQRPEIEIVLSLYDYPNFEDTRNGLIWTLACSGLYNDLGTPSPLELNTAAVAVIDAIETLADANPRIQHVRHLGQAQNAFGLPGLPPGTIAPPGLIDQPSPAAAMRERFIFGGLDCFHFNADAYDVLIDNLVSTRLSDRFADGLSVTLEQPAVIYNGQAQPAVLSTSPEGVELIVTYDGEAAPPVEQGSYALVATAPGWRGVFKSSYQILPTPQDMIFDDRFEPSQPSLD